MFLPADQPLLDCTVIDRLIAAFEQGGRDICHPIVAGRRRGPAIFGARHFAALRRLQGDVGGRSIIDANPHAVAAVPFSDETPFRDVDCPGDLAALLAACPGVGVNRGLSRAHLTRALGLGEARLIAICGAGGKTSLMAALVRELSARGERVLATTTTKMAIEEAEGPWRACEASGADDLLAHSARTLRQFLLIVPLIARVDAFSAFRPKQLMSSRKPIASAALSSRWMARHVSRSRRPLRMSQFFRAQPMRS